MPFPKRIGLLLAATLAASGLAFLIVTVDSGKMNAEAQAEPQLERQVENKIPKHVPITIKLKKEKEKAFKDIKNEKWLQDFELEVTNTSNKPIYFLELFVVLPEIVVEDGHSVAIPLRYGRVDFIDFDTMATPSDQPIPIGGGSGPSDCSDGYTWDYDAHQCCQNPPPYVNCGDPLPATGCRIQQESPCGGTPHLDRCRRKRFSDDRSC